MHEDPARPPGTVAVSACHNIAGDDHGRPPGRYRPGDPVVEVFRTTADATIGHQAIAEEIWMLLAVGDDAAFGRPDARAIAYRQRGNRGLGAGDVLCLDGTWLACTGPGFERISDTPVIVSQTRPGTTPL
jgi:hypothetical protein